MVRERALWNWEVWSIHGSRAAERKFHTKEKPLSESNARKFSKLYKEEIPKAQKNNRDVKKNLSVLPCGRPLLLDSLDQVVQRFLLSLQRTGGLVSSAVAISTTKALIAQNPQYNLIHINLDSSYWVQSLFRRMGFKKGIRTTGKVEIPEGARKEAELSYLHNTIVTSCHDCQEIRNPSFINHEFGPNSLKVHTCNESHYGKTKL